MKNGYKMLIIESGLIMPIKLKSRIQLLDGLGEQMNNGSKNFLKELSNKDKREKKKKKPRKEKKGDKLWVYNF